MKNISLLFQTKRNTEWNTQHKPSRQANVWLPPQSNSSLLHVRLADDAKTTKISIDTCARAEKKAEFKNFAIGYTWNIEI